jgi:hypothetical protein
VRNETDAELRIGYKCSALQKRELPEPATASHPSIHSILQPLAAALAADHLSIARKIQIVAKAKSSPDWK